MPAPTLRKLKARAQLLKPVIHLGKAGLTPALLAALDAALDSHGLVKVRFTELKEQKRELAEKLAAETSSRLVLRVGHTATLYRPRPQDA